MPAITINVAPADVPAVLSAFESAASGLRAWLDPADKRYNELRPSPVKRCTCSPRTHCKFDARQQLPHACSPAVSLGYC